MLLLKLKKEVSNMGVILFALGCCVSLYLLYALCNPEKF
ncbi:potassium-transporting ATPase subunit F [Bacillus massiliigorillae]